MKTIFTNAKVVTPARVIGRGGVAVENGVILQVFEGDGDQTDAQVVDCGGNYLAPGFIDTHIHGAGGADFIDIFLPFGKTMLHKFVRKGFNNNIIYFIL